MAKLALAKEKTAKQKNLIINTPQSQKHIGGKVDKIVRWRNGKRNFVGRKRLKTLVIPEV